MKNPGSVRVPSLSLPVALIVAALAAASNEPVAAQAVPAGALAASPACAGSPAAAERISRGDVSVSPGAPSGQGAALGGPTVFSADTTRAQRDSLSRRRGTAGTVGGDVATASTRAAGARSGSGVRSWTVQVASYETLDEATAMQQTLCQKGYETRVLGSGRPYTVRVGRYGTAAAALAVARHLANPKQTVFVTPAEPER